MGRKRVASTYIRGAKYNTLSTMDIDESLQKPSTLAIKLSSNAEEYGKLSPSAVYDLILDKVFFISPPELTKTARTVIATCWSRSMKLIVVKNEMGEFKYTG